MITSQSQLKVSKENRDYLFLCHPESPIPEVQAVLHEMLAFCDSVLKAAEAKADQVEKETSEKVTSLPDTEMTL